MRKRSTDQRIGRFGARVGSPEVNLLGSSPRAEYHLLVNEPFPARADPRMTLQRSRRIQIEQRMQQAAVRQIYLRCLDGPLAHVFPPGAQLPYDEQSRNRSRYFCTVVCDTPKERANSDPFHT